MTRPKYQEYINGPAWEAVRKRILKRARGKCEKCRARSSTLQVHHLTYDRLGKERDADLLAVCGPCHQAFHPEKQFLRPYFVGEFDCLLCPSETADIYVGDREVMYVCNGCGDATTRPKKRKRSAAHVEARETTPERPRKRRRPMKHPPKPATSPDPWEAAKKKQVAREHSMIAQGRKKLAAKGLKGFA